MVGRSAENAFFLTWQAGLGRDGSNDGYFIGRQGRKSGQITESGRKESQ